MNKRMLMSVILILFGLNAQANHVRNQLGRTELMNYVINQEIKKNFMDKEIDRLWHVCYETNEVFNGVWQDSNGRIHNKYKYETRRKISCTDLDIHNLENCKNDKNQWLSITLSGITDLVNSGAPLNLKDYDGNTVLNFCYTYEVYSRLRCLGADFQSLVWIYFHPATTILASAALCGIIVTITQ